MKFEEFNLKQPIVDAVYKAGFTQPTPIQEKAIPEILNGHDLIVGAQTGTGKTAAFVLPILNQLEVFEQRKTRALILVPTRELAVQTFDVCKKFGRYLKLRACCLYGGAPHKKQREALHAGCDILIATPGRLLDFMNQGEVRLNQIEMVILDEADRMLDMGFIGDVETIIAATPSNRQTILASATMPRQIQSLAKKILRQPVEVRVASETSTADTVNQYVVYCAKGDKKRVLRDMLNLPDVKKSIIFTRTKVNADRLAKRLEEEGIESLVIHGDKSQGQRIHSLQIFRSDKINVLIATDVAARGIDIPSVTHVFNFELPEEMENYIHRIGRAGRANKDGYAVTLCTQEEAEKLHAIEKMTKQKLQVIRTKYSIQPQNTKHSFDKKKTPKPQHNHHHNNSHSSKQNQRKRKPSR